MSAPLRLALVMVLLAAAGMLSYGPGKARHDDNAVLETVNFPVVAGQWVALEAPASAIKWAAGSAVDLTGALKLKKYVNVNGAVVYLSVADAAKFHEVKSALTGRGYEAFELPDTVIETAQGKWPAATVEFRGQGEHMLLMYWVILNGRQVSPAQRVVQEFLLSLQGRKHETIVVRMDIPMQNSDVNSYAQAGKNLAEQISRAASPQEQAGFFGSR